MDLLVKMEPSRKRPKKGDVFVIQPKEGIYFFGKVVITNITSSDLMVNGWNLIYIYKGSGINLEISDTLDDRDLLIPPQIVNNQGWLKGYFKTIGTLPITNKDNEFEYGFLDFKTKEYVDTEGKPLGYEPEMWIDYGLGSYGSVAYDVNQAIERNPDLLK